MKSNSIILATYLSPTSTHKYPKILVLFEDSETVHGLNLNLAPSDFEKDLKQILVKSDFENSKSMYFEKLRPLIRKYNNYRIWHKIHLKNIKILKQDFI